MTVSPGLVRASRGPPSTGPCSSPAAPAAWGPPWSPRWPSAAALPSCWIGRPPPDGGDYVQVDLADPAAAVAAVERAVQQYGPPTAVVTAAGTDACGKLDDVPLDVWTRVVAVNLLGTAAVVRAALPHLRANHGRVVTVASTLGHQGRLRRDGLLRVEVRRRRLHPGAGRRDAPARSASPCSIPGGMTTHFFDGRPEQYKPGPDAVLNDPAHVAEAILFALGQPAGCELRELVVAVSTESSWP